MIARRAFYSGHVQGVGFRYTVQRIAGRCAVTGYVRNLPEGRVELLAEGEPGEIDAFLARVAEAMRSHIRSVEQFDEAATGQFRGFEIER
jgi:acylphosphatase